MIDEDPAVIFRRLLRSEWSNEHIDVPFDIDRINTGQDHDVGTKPRITIIHVGDSTTGNTGYNYISAEGPITRVGVRMQVDIWVPNSDEWPSAGRAKNHRWQLQKEVDRIFHRNARGTITQNGDRQLQYIGVISRRRSTQSDPTPVIYRASMDVRTIYMQHPPEAITPPESDP